MRSERLRAEAELGLAARFGDVVWGFGSEHRSGNHGGEMVTTILNAHVDDAASWTPPRPLADGDGPYRHPCYFLDENRAWCVLAADFDNPIVIFATSDAGASWTPSGLGADEYTNWPEAPVVSIAFRDARRGTVKIVDEPCHHNGHIESTVTYTTRDGGLHWTFAGRTSTCLPPEDHCRGG